MKKEKRIKINPFIQADKAAAGLRSLGLKRGDRIGIWGPNSYEWLLTQWAAARIGLILVTTQAFIFLTSLK
jgi:fatty-acyl-CoA synthase